LLKISEKNYFLWKISENDDYFPIFLKNYRKIVDKNKKKWQDLKELSEAYVIYHAELWLYMKEVSYTSSYTKLGLK
jgi:DNA-binding transcriptional regulator PaaX